MDDEEALKESVSSLRSAILLGRTDIIRSILSTAAEYREEDGLFGDDEGEDQDEEGQLGVAKQFYYDEYDDPYDILKMMMNYVDNDAGTCLHLATKLSYADAVRALLSAGSDPTITNSEGATAFDYCTDKKILSVYNEELLQASANSNVPRVRKLLKAGVSANASDGATSDNKALHWAVSYGNSNIVKLLCESGAKVNILNKCGVTPLHDAVIRGDVDIVRILLEHGAVTDIKAKEGSYKGQTALDLVDNEEMRELLTTPVVKEEESGINGEVLATAKDQPSDTDSSVSEGGAPSITVRSSASSIPTTPSSLSLYQLLSEMPPLANSESLDPLFSILWPFPQKITQFKGARFSPASSLRVVLFRRNSSEYFEALCDIWSTVEGRYEQLGYTVDVTVVTENSRTLGSAAGSVECHVCPNSFKKSESYIISISAVKVVVTASDLPAMWCAVNTLLQIFRLFHGKGMPQSQINDWPDLKYRGVLWDISTGRVPNLETIFCLIDILSAMKINQLQLYMQNTFSYIGHETVWRNKTPYSASDIIKIDNYCKRRYVELVPHIESLSGFGHWLMFKPYQHLAEKEEEFDPKRERPPSCLCPTNDESLNMVVGLHLQALPCFSSTRFVHVGLDLAPEFGKGKSHVIAQAKGTDELYMSHLKSVYQSCCKYGHTVQFWANALHRDPEQLWNLPPGLVAMEYGYTRDHDFLKYCKPLMDAGVGFFVCPGTSSWNSACGDIDDVICVMNNAIQTGVTCDALGALICDWSLPGHVNPLTISIPALLVGAGLSWKANSDLRTVKSSLPNVLNQHVFLDNSCTFGQALLDLGKTNTLLFPDDASTSRATSEDNRVHPMAHASDGKLLWQVLATGGSANLDNVSTESVQRATRHIRRCHKAFLGAELQCKQKTEIIKELELLVDILLFATRVCRMLLLTRKQNSSVTLEDLPAINRTDLANKLLGLVDMYHKAYVLRNKQGGLTNALQLLQHFLKHLLPAEPN